MHSFHNLEGFDYRYLIFRNAVALSAIMIATWTERARDIKMQSMPVNLVKVVNIIYNDCKRKSKNCNWIFWGAQCMECSSFNTMVESLILGDVMSNR